MMSSFDVPNDVIEFVTSYSHLTQLSMQRLMPMAHFLVNVSPCWGLAEESSVFMFCFRNPACPAHAACGTPAACAVCTRCIPRNFCLKPLYYPRNRLVMQPLCNPRDHTVTHMYTFLCCCRNIRLFKL